MATACNFPPGDEHGHTEESKEGRLGRLQQLLCRLIEEGLAPETWEPIIVYGDPQTDPADAERVDWLIEQLREFRRLNQAEKLTKGGPLARMAQGARTVWRVDAPGFARTYPPLWTRALGVEEMVPLPCHAVDGLFIGNRFCRLSAAWMHPMGVRHAIVSSNFAVEQQQRYGEQETIADVCYLRVDHLDGPHEPMDAVFHAAVAFVRQAHDKASEDGTRNSHNVVLQLHGRSKSASLAIAILMAGTTRIPAHSFSAALAHVRTACPQADTAHMHLDQLRRFAVAPLSIQ